MIVYRHRLGQIIGRFLSDPGHQDIMAPPFSHSRDDPQDLLRRLTCTIDYLRRSLPDTAMIIDFCVIQIFKRLLLQIQHCLFRSHTSLCYPAKQFQYIMFIIH